MKTGDIGGDVLALNNELSLLGYNSVPGSDTYGWATSDGWKQLMADNGNTSDGSLSLADTLWIPEHEVALRVERNRRIHGDGRHRNRQNPRIIDETHHQKRHCIRAGTLTIFGITGTLPANTTEITDAGFLQQVEANDSTNPWTWNPESGIDATLALSERMRVLRVPPARYSASTVQPAASCPHPTIMATLP
ncbi:MAG: hypothetical protein ACLS6O_03600 [Bifidobacterium sp.]